MAVSSNNIQLPSLVVLHAKFDGSLIKQHTTTLSRSLTCQIRWQSHQTTYNYPLSLSYMPNPMAVSSNNIQLPSLVVLHAKSDGCVIKQNTTTLSRCLTCQIRWLCHQTKYNYPLSLSYMPNPMAVSSNNIQLPTRVVLLASSLIAVSSNIQLYHIVIKLTNLHLLKYEKSSLVIGKSHENNNKKSLQLLEAITIKGKQPQINEIALIYKISSSTNNKSIPKINIVLELSKNKTYQQTNSYPKEHQSAWSKAHVSKIKSNFSINRTRMQIN